MNGCCATKVDESTVQDPVKQQKNAGSSSRAGQLDEKRQRAREMRGDKSEEGGDWCAQKNEERDGSVLERDSKKDAKRNQADDDWSARSKTSLTSLSMLLPAKQQTKVIYRQFGFDPVDVLQVEQEEGFPAPAAPDHVVIKVQASTVTVNDCFLRRGFSFEIVNPVSLPVTPGYDVVGRIISCGTKVGSFKENERVAALIRTGGNARYISVPESSLVPVPRNLDSAEAATMVSIYTTAYQAMKLVSQQGPMFSLKNKKVLIIGAMDGVAQAIIQMCRKARAEIYATGEARRHAYIKNVLGANPLPPDSADWLPGISGTMNIVFDGFCDDGLEAASKALAADGEIVCFGHNSLLNEKEIGLFGAPMTAHLNKMWSFMKPKAKHIDIWESFQRDPETFKKNLKAIFQLLKWNKLKPHIARRISLSEVPNAHRKIERGEVRGTVVCLPWKRISSKTITKTKEDPAEN